MKIHVRINLEHGDPERFTVPLAFVDGHTITLSHEQSGAMVDLEHFAPKVGSGKGPPTQEELNKRAADAGAASNTLRGLGSKPPAPRGG